MDASRRRRAGTARVSDVLLALARNTRTQRDLSEAKFQKAMAWLEVELATEATPLPWRRYCPGLCMDNEPRSSAEDDDMELIKVTLGYCPHEDRVRMDGLGSTAGTIRIWFTARLLSLLARHLVKYAQQMESPANSDYEHKPDMSETDNSDQSAVILEQESREVLIYAVDVKTSSGDHLELTYKDSKSRETARLRLIYTTWKSGWGA